MKKGLFTFGFALLCIFSFGQTVHKGSLLGLHTSTPTLKEGVTMEDYVKFYTTKAIPAYEKAFPGIKMYLIKSLRGQDSSSIGVIYMFNSEADRNKYFNNNGTMTELGKASGAKLNDIGKEFDKYETQSNAPDRYNDWLVE
ncbi:MAG: hypothetical protein ABI834_05185 [Ginsengibacter sp.]